jgi:hypothetical protein
MKSLRFSYIGPSDFNATNFLDFMVTFRKLLDYSILKHKRGNTLA